MNTLRIYSKPHKNQYMFTISNSTKQFTKIIRKKIIHIRE
jgi:hypothetical protein